MKIFNAAALAILLSSVVACAQENNAGNNNGSATDSTTTSSTTPTTDGASSDPAAYLAGPNIQRFYTDDARTTMLPEADMKSQWGAMTEEERTQTKAACSGNKDNRWSTFCNSVGAM